MRISMVMDAAALSRVPAQNNQVILAIPTINQVSGIPKQKQKIQDVDLS